MPSHSVVISGSFRRHLDEIMETARQFSDIGVTVLSPTISKAVEPDVPFVLLESDDTSNTKILEQRHLDAIAAADALYVYNRDGYLGSSTALELGWAVALGKPVFCHEPPADTTLAIFCKHIATPAEMLQKLRKRSPLNVLNNRSSVTALQLYVRDMVLRRNFRQETPQDVLLLLVEELGELAKAIRKYIGLKVDERKSFEYPALSGEIADVLIYLLHLSNLTGISQLAAQIGVLVGSLSGDELKDRVVKEIEQAEAQCTLKQPTRGGNNWKKACADDERWIRVDRRYCI